LGLPLNIIPKLPQIYPKLTPFFEEKLHNISQLNNIILISPEANSNMIGDIKFWEQLVSELNRNGWTVVSNIINHKWDIKGAINDIDMSLDDLIALGYKCKAVITAISGFASCMVGIGKNLFILDTVYFNNGEILFNSAQLNLFNLNRNYGLTDINEYIKNTEETITDIINKIGKAK
jgi:hypothetical protein